MKIPEHTYSSVVANYWGIKSLGAFKKLLLSMNKNCKVMFYENGKYQTIRVLKLRKELGI